MMINRGGMMLLITFIVSPASAIAPMTMIALSPTATTGRNVPGTQRNER